ncbi:MAG: EAL domain-containing protein [Betaproteobacteria bacterium]|nr:EAL domain-containing protein [Betaproteobacteria bacterium]
MLTRNNDASGPRTDRVILAGFVAVLALLAVVAGVGLSRMVRLHGRMEKMLARDEARAAILSSMRFVTRERYVALSHIVILPDPFERDDEFIRMQRLASHFVALRERLMGLGLRGAERDQWERIRRLIRNDQRYYRQVAGAATAGQMKVAAGVLLQGLRPRERVLLGQMSALLRLQRAQTRAALVQADAAYRRTYIYLAWIGGFALLVAGVIALVVVRHTARAERDLLREKERAEHAAEQLSWAAAHDALTGLANRREFEHRVAELIANARTLKKQHALLYLDLDQFKVVNDTCGHAAGDELLRQLSGILEARLRTSDLLARLGGDEFGVLLEGCTLEAARQIAESLRSAVMAHRFVWHGKIFAVRASVGVAPITPDSELSTVLSAADAACYIAKDEGRNQVYVYAGEAEGGRRQGEMRWVQRVAQALEENRLCLYYQKIEPLVPTASSERRFELLLRMKDGAGALVPPMAFLPAAERYNMMPAIDRWVARAAFEHLASRPSEASSIFSINLSGQSLGDKGLLEFLVSELRRTGIRPQALCFEITETAAIANLSRATAFIQALKGLGCRFALDDFGSGMSSFGYLKHLEVDCIKIDGCFVRGMARDRVDFATVEAINRIARVMGMKTVAEFVDDEAILESLRKIEVDYVQGYAIHVPEPLEGSAVG